MPILRLRRIGNSLGLLLPKELVDAKRLAVDVPVHVEVERAARLEDVAGRLRKYHLTVRDWVRSTHEGEDS